MDELRSGLQLRVVWQEGEPEDLIEIEARASNGSFAGSTKFYGSAQSLGDFARSLDGFPAKPGEQREFRVGGSNDYTEFSMRFLCFNLVGHTALELTIRRESSAHRGADLPIDFARFSLRFEPEGLRRFAAQLRKMSETKEGSASLPDSPWP